MKIKEFFTYLLKAMVPIYGNYTGPGWTGGKRLWSSADTNGNKPPVDRLDELSVIHDKAYERASDSEDIYNADIIYLESVLKLPENPEEWSVYNTRVADAYLKLLIKAFRIKTRTQTSSMFVSVAEVLCYYFKYWIIKFVEKTKTPFTLQRSDV